MRLDLDGILEVAAVEKRTGASKRITIANALRAKSADEIAAGQSRIRELYESRGEILDENWETPVDVDEAVLDAVTEAIEDDSGIAARTSMVSIEGDVEARHLLERSRRLLDQMHLEDREAAIELHEKIEAALDAGSASELQTASEALEELLFFVEGQR